MFHDFINQVIRFFALVAIPHALNDIGKAHDAQTHRTVLLVREVCFSHAGAGDVDEVIELTHRNTGALIDLGPVHGAIEHVHGEVDRREVTHRHVVFILRQANLGAEVREVNGARVVVDGTVVDGVFPGQPGVAGALKRNQDGLELFAGPHLLEHAQFSGFGHLDILGVPLGERSTIELVEVGNLQWVKQVPGLVVFDALHEFIGNPHGSVGGAGATVRVTRVLTQVQELGEVHVPVLHVETQRTKLLASAAHRAQHRVNGVHEGDGARGTGVIRANGRTLCAELGYSQSDTTGSLGQPHHIAGCLRDVLDVILHFHHEAVCELRVARSSVDQSGACGQVLQLGHLVVEGDGVISRVCLVE